MIAIRGGRGIGVVQLFAGRHIYRHAFTLIAVLRFDHDREADFAGDRPASSTSSTARPAGTGTPAAASSFLVNSLFCAIASAIALARSISAA